MKTASPWWVSLTLGIGVLLFAVSERMFGHIEGVRYFVSGIGIGAVLVATAARVWTMTATTGTRRAVERVLVLCHVGVLVAFAVYALSTSWGLDHFTLSAKGAEKLKTVLVIVYALLFAASLVPLLMIELSLGVALRGNFDVHTVTSADDATVELYRVREISWSGLSIALATALCMVTCSVANQRNISKDVSYFKTSSPSDSSVALVANSPDPMKVVLWFPDPNEVKDQVRTYFESLSSSAGSGKLTIEERDRYVDADLATRYKVTFKDDIEHPKGMITLIRGSGDKEKSQSIELDADLNTARKATGKLRVFDKDVNQALMKLAREKRKAYVIAGHGEITNPETIPPDLRAKIPDRKSAVFKKALTELNYETKDLASFDLVKDVPDDATIVFLIGPAVALRDLELAALDRYLNRGGRLMIAFDPLGDGTLGVLEGKLGVKFNPAVVTDLQNIYPLRGNKADRRVPYTTQFSAHASTTSASRDAEKQGMILFDSGALEDVPFKVSGEAPRKTITVRTMDTSFLDYNDDMEFTADGPRPEKKQKWNIGAAIEGPKLKDADGKDKDGFRVLVYADAQLFADVGRPTQAGMLYTMLGAHLFGDSVKWLGGEEVFAGEAATEEDKAIQHTKSQDAVWFTVTVVGAPLLVLAVGLVLTLGRRRNPKKAEVTP